MIKLLLSLATLTLLAGCKTAGLFSVPSASTDLPPAITASSTCSPMLGWLGGICILGGMILLVITRGTMGWRPVIGGIIFIGINWALSLYGGWFFLPVAICTGAISLAWTGKIVWKIVNDDEIKLKEIKL